MRVRVRYFAAARERAGVGEESVEVAAGSTVASLLASIGERRAALRPLLDARRLRAAVNQEFASPDRPLADGDEVALIPPVAGGAGAAHVELSRAPLSVDAALERVRHPGAGGLCVFLGVVRNNHDGRRVDRMEYEAYDEMALRELRAIADSIVARPALSGVRLAVVHRVGSLEVGDASVVIAASAPHRAEAFAACREMIDRLKETVPIWKKEFGEGEPVWVDCDHPASGAR